MFAKINHMAMFSHQYTLLGKFYEAVFGLKSSGRTSPYSSVVYGDGYVGLNIIPRRDGAPGGLDHFGMVVEDVEKVRDRMKKRYPETNVVKRPSTRPFAAFSGHDPDGNIFDLAQKKEDTRKDIYADQAASSWHQDRYLNRYAIRAIHAEKVAAFYMDVFELVPLNKKVKAGSYHLTDGRVTLSIMPWCVTDYEGMVVKRPGPEHIGFKVENLTKFKADLKKVSEINTYLAPVPLGGSTESEVRRRFFEKSATGRMQMTDPDGVWIDVTDK